MFSLQPTAPAGEQRCSLCLTLPHSASHTGIPALSLLKRKGKKKKQSNAYPRNAPAFFPSDSIWASRPRSRSELTPLYNFAQATSGYLCRCGVFALSRDDKRRSRDCRCAAGSPGHARRVPHFPSALELRLWFGCEQRFI